MPTELTDNPLVTESSQGSTSNSQSFEKEETLAPITDNKRCSIEPTSEAAFSEVYDSGRDAWMTLGGTYVPLSYRAIDKGHRSSTCVDGWYNSAHMGKLLCDLLRESFLIFSLSIRYILAFGVYQDYYTRIFLSQTTPSNIRYRPLTHVREIPLIYFPVG